MIYPNFKEEQKLWKRGYARVAGLDESGRGPLAGPVVAAAVLVKFKNQKSHARRQAGKIKIKDSKKFSEKQREFFYEKLTKNSEVAWGVGVVSEKVIDNINILEATKLAMKKAVQQMEKKSGKIQYLLIDGNFKVNMSLPQTSVVKGDEKIFSIAAASIIAKVYRDRLMLKYHKKYPQYGFDCHKGYGTRAHFAVLQKHGPCKIHRKTFYPVNLYI